MLCIAAMTLVAACSGPQPASDAPETKSETKIVTDTSRWETEQSLDTLTRLKGPVDTWAQNRR
jgi:hypothetical protein